ncbi:hypothetical protein [Bdellovibrio sp. HCB337]|uniref:hypothetical protein n=1 Tax=Bdellovibrio sp. HCB337 TaxID=3394358 RepID=UPI0039A6AAB6
MNLRLRAYDLVLKTLVCLSTTLILSHAQAAIFEDTEEDKDVVEDYRGASDLVELHTPVEIDAPYRERRNTHGFLFGLYYENIILDRYVSILDGATFYQDMFGESEFPLFNLELSYKYNFSLGALTASFGGGYGEIKDDGSGVMRSLAMTKYQASVGYIMDTLFEEPYGAPYFSVGIMRVSIDEDNSVETLGHDIDMLYHLQAGVMFQLNWLDSAVARKSLVDYGLQNTYLDVFVSQYSASESEDDPDTSTEYTIGAGLRLEY